MSKEKKTLNVVGHSKLFYSISCALIAIFIILTFVIGLNVAIEFKGGTVLTYTYEGDIKTSDVSNTVSDSIGDKCTVTLGENTGNAGKTVEIKFSSTKLPRILHLHGGFTGQRNDRFTGIRQHITIMDKAAAAIFSGGKQGSEPSTAGG